MNGAAGYPTFESTRDQLSLNTQVSVDVEEFLVQAADLEVEERSCRRVMELYSWTGRKDLTIKKFESLAVRLERELVRTTLATRISPPFG